MNAPHLVIPANAGIQDFSAEERERTAANDATQPANRSRSPYLLNLSLRWIPAFAGMTFFVFTPSFTMPTRSCPVRTPAKAGMTFFAAGVFGNLRHAGMNGLRTSGKMKGKWYYLLPG
jgi:hypothetical protein